MMNSEWRLYEFNHSLFTIHPITYSLKEGELYGKRE